MRKQLLFFAVILIFAGAVPVCAVEKDHVGHGMNWGNHKPGNADHQEVVDGIKTIVNIMAIKEVMEGAGMNLPEGFKETHHISASFNDMKTGKPVEKAEVMVKLQYPDKTEQVKNLTAMHGHFGADFDMKAKGRYLVMCRFRLPDGKSRSTSFWYTVN